MGYSRDARTGRLCCDGCGTTGGVRKRTCPYKVTCDSLRGQRSTVAYCPPPALCPACYEKEGGLRGVHPEGCKTGAAVMQAEADAVEAGLTAGESFVVSAFGDWHEDVPAGLVMVVFRGRSGESRVLVEKDEYDPRVKPRLSDYAPVMAAAAA